ncbi:MAG: amidohydrolase [Lachnospiraceae bacterium]|nr:amidohydrolase [Lachnospiraceae bacterium]
MTEKPLDLAAKITEKSKKASSQIISHRHYLHTHPETGFDLTKTLEYVKKELQTMGYEPIPCGKAGLVALAGGKKPGKVFLLRADMDALPMKEEADIHFASSNDKMHACGHDMHTAMLLGAARILKELENEINGTVKLMFQPAEEILEGAFDMLQNGVLKNPAVDAGLMIHVMTGMPFPSGTAIVSDGGVSAPAADYFTIEIQGKGCHGSMPNTGIDPITIASHIIIALQEIHARELNLMDKAALTIGSFFAGKAANIIPDKAILQGSLRAFDEEVRNQIKKRMTEIAIHTAEAFRAKATVTFGSGCPTLYNDAELSACTLKYIQELNGSRMAFTASKLIAKSDGKAKNAGGSEDFAYISHQIPTIMLALAAGQPEEDFHYPLHHPKVKFDDKALPVGAAIYAYTALRWLEEH